mmetsp:Transcript_5627/g.8263  ORF Transcript_5627/g.8263 Transcript_5627/m.8263 type:complete len:197 (+) Transcript_5627:1049-1639(+)
MKKRKLKGLARLESTQRKNIESSWTPFRKRENYKQTQKRPNRKMCKKDGEKLRQKHLRTCEINASVFKTSRMNDKCKAELKGIQQRKMVKDAESIKQARRLEKRAEILRKKYYIDFKEQGEQAPHHQNQEASEDICISFQTAAGAFNKHPPKKPKKLTEDEVKKFSRCLGGIPVYAMSYNEGAGLKMKIVDHHILT